MAGFRSDLGMPLVGGPSSEARLGRTLARLGRRQQAKRLRVSAEAGAGGKGGGAGKKLKWGTDGLLPVIVQDVDTGRVLMQAYSNEAAVRETLQTGLATFYSRSRQGRWCKGETSNNYIRVTGVFADCDQDSIVYLGSPDGPACHTNAPTCYFTEVSLEGEGLALGGSGAPLPTLSALEHTILERQSAAQEGMVKPSWTAKLLRDPALLCSKVREEAGELCQTLEAGEGKERAASEAADVLYHTLVLLRAQGVEVAEVLSVLRARFSLSGIEEKASRTQKKA